MSLDELTALKEKAEIAVNLLKKMAHKDRLLILCHLVSGELSAGELSRLSLLSQSAFSQHLAILRNDNLVKTRKVSQTIYYSLADDSVIKVLEVLKHLYC